MMGEAGTRSEPNQEGGSIQTPPHEIADAMPHIVWTSDADGRATYFNRRWTEYTGLDLAESLRVGPSSVLHPDEIAAVQQVFLQARERGEALETTYRLRRASDGAFRWHLTRVVPFLTRQGRVVSWVGTAVDIDDQQRASEEQRYLVNAGQVLGASLDIERTLNDVGRMLVPHLADWFAIDLVAAPGALERAAVAHVDPSKIALAGELARRLPPRPDDPRGVWAVIRTRTAEMYPDIPDELLVASIPDPDLLALTRSLGLRSSMCVPLVARDRVLGALTLVSSESGRRYGGRDLGFAEELARRVAIAVDNARLYTEATQARAAAEAMAAEVIEQSHSVEAALMTMRAERDAALAKVAQIERAASPPGGQP